MRKLKEVTNTTNTTTLHLNLEKKWFDMIASGEKQEEYRDLSDYWAKRINIFLSKEGVKTITFSNGYNKERRQMEVLVIDHHIGYGLKKWGANGRQHILKLGFIIDKNF